MNRRRRAGGRALLRLGCSLALGLLPGMMNPAAGPPPLLARDQIHAGQRGELHTVLQGSVQETLPLEIIGVAESFVGPGRDIILARLEGPVSERSGVVAGMSGSPVFIDGRLVGALSYGMGAFQREAFAGITPIQDMLDLPRDLPGAAGNLEEPTPGEPPVEPLFGLAPWPEPGSGAPRWPSTPLAVGGAATELADLFTPRLQELGLGPWTSAVVEAEPAAAGELRAGDPVAVVLVGGDLTVAGTGTVTLVDDGRVLAMGHPLVRGGAIDFPMARASILATVPSLLNSFKLSRIGDTVGAFHQDRLPGLAGLLGARARIIPVRVTVRGADGRAARPLEFRVVRAAQLAPALVELVVANAILAHREGGLAGTVKVHGEVRLGSLPPVPVETAATTGGMPPAVAAARHAAGLFAALRLSPFAGDADMAVDLEVELSPRSRNLRLIRAQMDRPRARPGEEVRVTALLADDSRGATLRRSFLFTVPDLPTGSILDVVVGDGAAVTRRDGLAGVAAVQSAGSAAALVQALSAIPAAQDLHLWVGESAPGLLVGAQPLPALPPSVLRVMEQDGTARQRARLQQVCLHRESRREDGVVAGEAALRLEIE